ncbi:hypothetical protein ACJ5H2_16205 [Nocardioides sp. R1-1]|uniref:hypothetical protein n=1 Tax=Nocardioides sp. R1-1 TaxID=3383502 RepID=UPI0038D1D49F
MPWFTVRSHYRFAGLHSGRDVYEERVVLFQALDAEGAIVQAEREAAEYAEGIEPCEVLPLFQSFTLFDEPRHRAELYSLMRVSDLEPDPYLDHFFDTGDERTS